MAKETLSLVHKELSEEIVKQSRFGRLNFLYPNSQKPVRTLALISNPYYARHFAQVLTRPEVRVDELEQGDNPWELILENQTASPENVCHELPPFIWSHFPAGSDSDIRLFSSLEDYRTWTASAILLVS